MRNKKPELSIIIPCYNGEPYIRRCIDKVLSVDLNKEIIVINDASTDKSLDLLLSYGKKIVLINLDKNMGVSHARNLGINIAKAKYLSFIDIDDDFEVDMHKIMLNKIISENSDVCICDNDVRNNKNEILISKYSVNFKDISQREVVRQYLIDRIFPAVWASIYKTELAKKIQFNENLRIGEDILFVLRYLLKAKQSSFIPKPLYHYIQNDSSTMHNISDKFVEYLDVPKCLTKLEIDYLEKYFYEEFKYFQLEMVERAVHALSSTSKKNKHQAITLLKKVCNKKVCTEIIQNVFSYKYLKIEFFIFKTFGIRFHLFIFPFYSYIRKLIRGYKK